MQFSTLSSLAVLLLAADTWACGLPPSYTKNRGSFTRTRPTVVVEATTIAPSSSPTTAATLIPTTVAAVATTTATSAASTSTAAASSDLTTDQQNALDAHNAARSEVGTAALAWDASLAADAQAYAETLVSLGALQHSQVSGQGENLYMQSSASTPYLSAANAWISEKSSYNGEVITSTNYMNFGHYTQVVWSTTTKVGLGIATDSRGNTYVVGRYSPPGNYIGQAAY